MIFEARYIFFSRKVFFALSEFTEIPISVRIEDRFIKEIFAVPHHFKQNELKNYSFQLLLYFETNSNNTKRWIILNKTWLYDFCQSKYFDFGSLTTTFHDIPTTYSPVILQLGVKTYYSLDIHHDYIQTLPESGRDPGPPHFLFCHKSNIMILTLIRKNVSQAWNLMFNDDVYLNLPMIQTYYEEEILNLPNPYNHLVIRGHCELVTMRGTRKNPYVVLHGGCGFLVSWLFAYSCDCLSEELMRRQKLGSDWEMMHIVRSFGISCYETGSPYVMGFTDRAIWKLQSSSFPPCAPLDKKSSSCQPYNYWVNLGKVFIYHWASQDPYLFPKIMSQFRNKDIYYNILTYYYCNMSTAKEKLLQSPQHMKLKFSYNPSLGILRNIV